MAQALRHLLLIRESEMLLAPSFTVAVTAIQGMNHQRERKRGREDRITDTQEKLHQMAEGGEAQRTFPGNELNLPYRKVTG